MCDIVAESQQSLELSAAECAKMGMDAKQPWGMTVDKGVQKHPQISAQHNQLIVSLIAPPNFF